MRIITDDGKEFTSMESYKKYEESKKNKSAEKEMLLDGIGAVKDEIDDLRAKLDDLIDQYAEKYPDRKDLADLLEIFDEFELDDDEDDCICACDECVAEVAEELIRDFERLQDLIHRRD